MKKFQFSLQKVLDVRLIEEKILKKNLAVLINEYNNATKKAQYIKSIINNQWELGGKMVKNSTVDSSKMMMHYNYLKSLKGQYLQQQTEIGLIVQKKNKAKQKLAEKAKERKTLEILKDNKLKEHKKQHKHFEQAFFDEVSQGAKLRNMKTGS